MPDPPGCLFEHREILEEIRVFHLLDPTMGCKRSHLEARAVGLQVLQVGDRGDVHEGGGANEPEVHHGDQALAAGQQFSVVTQLGELLDALLHRVRSLVLKGSRFQPSCFSVPQKFEPSRALYSACAPYTLYTLATPLATMPIQRTIEVGCGTIYSRGCLRDENERRFVRGRKGEGRVAGSDYALLREDRPGPGPSLPQVRAAYHPRAGRSSQHDHDHKHPYWYAYRRALPLYSRRDQHRRDPDRQVLPSRGASGPQRDGA